MRRTIPLLLPLLAGDYTAAMPREPDPSEATELLRRAGAGGETEQARLVELLHAELRDLAARAMSSEREGHTLQPTALVNEAWVKLFEPDNVHFGDRRHFLAVSARVMRQVLVDHARGRKRLKRGGGWQRMQIDEAEARLAADDDAGFDLVALDGALDSLRAESPRAAQVVELRFFGGLSVEETADAMELSERSVAREWRFARAWLARRLESA